MIVKKIILAETGFIAAAQTTAARAAVCRAMQNPENIKNEF